MIACSVVFADDAGRSTGTRGGGDVRGDEENISRLVRRRCVLLRCSRSLATVLEPEWGSV